MYDNNLYLPKSNTMKLVSKVLFTLLLAALPLSLFAQGPTIVLEYMKVTQESEGLYLEVEQAWKEIHKKRIDEGLSIGWQLWRNVYAGYGDPYQYVTINWYKDWAHSLAETPDDFWAAVWESAGDDLYEKTAKSRVLVDREVTHQVMAADSSAGASYILVNRMKVKPGMGGDYEKFEREFAKPLYEEAIRRGQGSHWGVWNAFPFDAAHLRYSTVDGYNSIEQLTAGGEDLMPIVHPDLTWEEAVKKSNSIRTMVSSELWELVDFVFPEDEE